MIIPWLGDPKEFVGGIMVIGPATTVASFLERLDTTFVTFARAFNEGHYVLWLGSGISRDRVPNVGEIIEQILEHLRSNIAEGDPQCDFRQALSDVVRLANLTKQENASLDLAIPVGDWPLKDRVVTALIGNYAAVLDVPVGVGRPEDYLVWTALDAPNTYGAPDLEPDVEHYGIAILALEGVAHTAVTANWDALLERALDELTPAFGSRVRVAIAPDDFRAPPQQINVIKFHGCAVRALDDEAVYRDMLIARHSQISAWTTQPGHQLMKQHLEILYSTNPTLMIGLSAQDANLHTVFATAIQHLARTWPSSPPAVVLSELAIEAHHRTVLKLTYGTSHQANASAIADSALLGAYGKTTILALVLSALTEKLSYLIEHAIDPVWGAAAVTQLQSALKFLRDEVASFADPKDSGTLSHRDIVLFQRQFVRSLIRQVHFILNVFRSGSLPDVSDLRYEPLSERPIAQAVHNADFPADQFGLLGVALALVGRGVGSGDWSAVAGSAISSMQAAPRLVTARASTRLVFVKDATTLTRLELDDSFDGEALVIVAEKEPVAATRSPRARYGRDGKSSHRRYNIATAIAETGSVDELYESFKLAGGL